MVRYNRNNLNALIEQINASGYGLTLGVHTRIDETIAQVTGSAKVGNLYVNRNMVGAVVGVQPFGGEGLSGTGPKAGGPLYLYRLLANRPERALGVTLARQDADYPVDVQLKTVLTQPLEALISWAEKRPELRAVAQQYGELAQAGTQRLLPGPTGERNTWTLMPRERVLCVADNEQDALVQLTAAMATGCEVLYWKTVCTAIWRSNCRKRFLPAFTLRSLMPCLRSRLTRLSTTVIPISCANCASRLRPAAGRLFRCRASPAVKPTCCWSACTWSVRSASTPRQRAVTPA